MYLEIICLGSHAETNRIIKTQSVPHLLTPKRAKGFYVIEENRKKCGLSDEWIKNIKEA